MALNIIGKWRFQKKTPPNLGADIFKRVERNPLAFYT